MQAIVEHKCAGMMLEQQTRAFVARLPLGHRQMEGRIAQVVLDVAARTVREQEVGGRVIALAYRQEQRWVTYEIRIGRVVDLLGRLVCLVCFLTIFSLNTIGFVLKENLISI